MRRRGRRVGSRVHMYGSLERMGRGRDREERKWKGYVVAVLKEKHNTHLIFLHFLPTFSPHS